MRYLGSAGNPPILPVMRYLGAGVGGSALLFGNCFWRWLNPEGGFDLIEPIVNPSDFGEEFLLVSAGWCLVTCCG